MHNAWLSLSFNHLFCVNVAITLDLIQQINVTKKLMPGCPLDTETSSVNVYKVSARIETAARGSE